MPEVTLRQRAPLAAIPPLRIFQRAASASTDEHGFYGSANLEEIEKHGFALTPGRSCGSAVEEDEGEPFEVRIPELVATLEKQFAEGAALEDRILKDMASAMRNQ